MSRRKLRTHPLLLVFLLVAGCGKGCGKGCSCDVSETGETGGAGGSGGSAQTCTPGAVQSCYEGPTSTEGMGPCTTGTRTCNATGTDWSACQGQVLPASESCATPADDDCDGTSNEDCICVPLATENCYGGPNGTEGIGKCKAGTRTCAADGLAFGACVGEVMPTPEDCTTLADEDCDGQNPPCPVSASCAARFGDGAYQTGEGVAMDVFGNTYITGTMQGTVDFGGGPRAVTNQSAYVVKVDANCGHVWSRTFESMGGWAKGNAIAVDSFGNVLFGGEFFGSIDFGGGPMTSTPGPFEGDMYLVKLDSAGNHVWSKRFGDTAGDQIVSGIATDAANNVIFTANLPGTADFGGGNVAGIGVVVKLAPDGAHQWSRGWQWARGRGVTADSAGNVLVSGTLEGPADFGGGTLSPNGNGKSVYVAKYDASGVHLWSKAFGDDAGNADVAVGPADTIVVAGAFGETLDLGGGALVSAGLDDIFAVVFDSMGVHMWSKRFGDASMQDARAVATDAQGNLFVAGSFIGSLDFGGGTLVSAGSWDAFVAKLSPMGDHVWSKRFGDATNEFALGVAANAGGHSSVVGSFGGTVDLGLGPMTSAGNADVVFGHFGP